MRTCAPNRERARRNAPAWRGRSISTVAGTRPGPSRPSRLPLRRPRPPTTTGRASGRPTASPPRVTPRWWSPSYRRCLRRPERVRQPHRFRTDSGLPAIQSCTLATLTTLTTSAPSPCFTKTNQTGGTSLPAADAGWANEIDLDLQAASAVCPMCSILLLEANTSSIGNLGTAVTTASNTAHVRAISNSYGISGDYPGSFAPAFDNAAKKGIAVTASAGDGGFGILFPASATNVIGVGGTTLSVDATGVRTTETVWAGTGSGCSVYNAAPAWQSIPGNPCAGKKADLRPLGRCRSRTPDSRPTRPTAG